MTATFLEAWAPVVRRGGDRPAVEAPDACLTRAELWAWARAVGGRLAREGVGPGSLVGLALEKSAAYVAALLGSWWAGAAFVPLAPSLPPGRRRSALEQAAPALVVDEAWVRSTQPGGAADGATRTGGGSGEAGPRPLDPGAPAYVMFTSGSGGEPKGVVVAHRGLVSVLAQQIEAFGLDEGARSLFVLATCFDASVSDLGTALLAGATLVIAPEGETRDGPSLVRALARRRITYVDLPPSLLRAIDPADCPAGLRCIVIGGEPCPPETVRRWAARVRVVNVYGPTEATICSSLCACDPQGWSRPLIGRPLAGVDYLVLDAEGRAPAAGGVGELYIGGEHLAVGYLKRPDLTAERFVTIEGRRLYRTGDRVMVREGGELEFVGRVDRQVKVGGVRVELEEIEAELARAPGVVEAAVVRRAEGEGGGLVAFVALAGDAGQGAAPGVARPGPAGWRARLGERLPSSALPRAWAFVDALPRGPTGKVDLVELAGRAALGPDPFAPRPGRGDELAALWARALGAWPGPGDRFLDAGGDSLAALHLTAAAEALGFALSAEFLFSNPRFDDLIDAPGRATPAAASADLLRLDAASFVATFEAGGAASPRGAAGGAGPRGARTGGAAGHALVTGATGFFGAHLLAALAGDYARYTCLVRAPDEASGSARLAAAAARYGLPFDGSRVRALVGDASLPRFGLPPPIWRELCDDLSAVFHSAGVVNMSWPYERLRPGNLAALAEALRLANEGAPKPLHHASTLSVFVSAEPSVPRPREDDGLEGTRVVYGGYAQSKWAAEHLLRLSARGAAPLACYRLGLLTGAAALSERGAPGAGRAAPGDQLSLVFAGLARLGRAPRDRAGLRFDVTPVDYAAAALAQIARGGEPPAPGEVATYHLAGEGGATADDLVTALRAEGVAVEDVDAGEWQALGRALAAGPPDEAAAAAHLAFSRAGAPGAYARQRPLELFQATGVVFDDARARRALEGSGLRPPAAGAELLRRYARLALRGEGAAAAPRGGGAVAARPGGGAADARPGEGAA
ncbi:MAG TPA: amino acid adenylation domain-containing protein [Polyangiaceae bacterium]|nr:amino acid adenylation domain-containing protein [Polyangiaceae bacterium]